MNPTNRFTAMLLVTTLVGTTGCLSITPTRPTSANNITTARSTNLTTVHPDKRSPSPSKPSASTKTHPMTSSNFSVIDFGYTPLHEGYFPKPQALVFQNQQSWVDFWQTSQRLDANLQKPVAPQVDFSNQTIIGITPGSRNTGGYGLKVENVELKKGNGGDRWVIHYTESTPGDCMVTQATTTPAVFISISKSALPVELQGRQVSSTCK